MRILVEDRDPKWAATLANAVAEAYITETLSVRSSMAQGASDWLETQLADLEAKLAKSGDTLFKFKQEHDIVSTSWEDRQSIVSQRIVAINDALTKARVLKAQIAARNEQLAEAVEAMQKDPESPDGTMLLTQNTAIPELKIRYLDAKVECADLTSRYLENHPRAQACAAKVSTAKASLDKEIRGTLEAAKRENEEAVQAERKLLKLLDETKSDSFGLNQFEKDYLELKRSHDNNQRLYEMVLRRCHFVVVSDASCDEGGVFQDLGSAVRKIRADMGVPIDFEGGIGILPRSADPVKRAGSLYWALGRIRYSIADPSPTPVGDPGVRDGWLLYIKPAFCGTEPPDVCEYAMAHGSFPHESTTDQFFSESQFESYRMLGSHVMQQMSRDWKGGSLADFIAHVSARLPGAGKPA